MPYKNIIISVVMIAALGLATWTTFLSGKPPILLPTQTAALPDAFMEDVTALIMNKLGKPRMKIVTPKLVHFADQDTTRLTSPQLTLYRQSPEPWYITSKYATASLGVDKVDFFDEVTIHHAADQHNPATLIKTSALTVYPNKQTAETNALITLVQPSITIKAVGMFADMNTGNIKLLSATKGEYVPNS